MWSVRLVEGESMLPCYRPGQTVIVSNSRNFKVGDVVVAFMRGREVLKRITAMKDGHVYLEGDNPDQSTDSRQYGWLIDRHVVGKVTWPKKQPPPSLEH